MYRFFKIMQPYYKLQPRVNSSSTIVWLRNFSGGYYYALWIKTYLWLVPFRKVNLHVFGHMHRFFKIMQPYYKLQPRVNSSSTIVWPRNFSEGYYYALWQKLYYIRFLFSVFVYLLAVVIYKLWWVCWMHTKAILSHGWRFCRPTVYKRQTPYKY